MSETTIITDIKIENVCRACLEESDDLRSLFKAGKVCGEITTLSEMLGECTSLEIREGDELPGYICTKCVLQVSKSFIFRQTCLKSDAILRERIQSKSNEEEVYNTIYFYDENVEQQQNVPEEQQTDEVVSNYEDEVHLELKQDSSDVPEVVTKEDITEYEINDDAIDDECGTGKSEYCDDDNQTNSTTEDKSDTDSTINPPEKIIFKKRKQRTRKLPGPPFKCEVCGKILSNHSSYKYHMQLHSDNTPFLCSECGEGFKTRNAYDGHMTTHNKNNPHTCKICGKSYRQAGSLRCHMLTHTGEKPFLCGICGKGMTQKSGFKKHMLTHTGEKPHTCNICGKMFRYSSNLITHKRAHTGDKPYECEVCDKRFVGGEQLKRHAIVHTGEKPFECDFCGKFFNRRSSLIVHGNLHSGEKKHICQLCGKGFIQLHCLKNHLQTHKIDEEEIVGGRQEQDTLDQ